MARRAEIIVRLALASVFITAGALKALDPSSFAQAIHHYQLTPWAASVAAAHYLPWLEITCGICLFHPKLRLAALWILIGLILVFSGALGSAWARGLDIECGCFGSGAANANYPLSLVRNAVLLSALVFSAIRGILEKPGVPSRASSENTPE